MPSLSKMKPHELRKRLAELTAELQEQVPAQLDEFLLVQRLLSAAENGIEPQFAKVRGVIGAIELCLDLTGDWMTKQQIYEMMVGAGFEMKPETGRYLVSDALKYHVGRGRIQKTIPDPASKLEYFGRKDWTLK